MRLKIHKVIATVQFFIIFFWYVRKSCRSEPVNTRRLGGDSWRRSRRDECSLGPRGGAWLQGWQRLGERDERRLDHGRSCDLLLLYCFTLILLRTPSPLLVERAESPLSNLAGVEDDCATSRGLSMAFDDETVHFSWVHWNLQHWILMFHWLRTGSFDWRNR